MTFTPVGLLRWGLGAEVEEEEEEEEEEETTTDSGANLDMTQARS